MTNRKMLRSALTSFHPAGEGDLGSLSRTPPAPGAGGEVGDNSVGAGGSATTVDTPIAGSAGPVDVSMPGGPWRFRASHRPGRRAAMEVYEHGELLDVVVESALERALLRGARRGGGGGRWRRADGVTVAWGRMPHDGLPPVVTFLRRIPRQRPCIARVVSAAGRFWFAYAEGAFHHVRVESPTGEPARLRVTRASVARAS